MTYFFEVNFKPPVWDITVIQDPDNWDVADEVELKRENLFDA